jgi:hypothetical protein
MRESGKELRDEDRQRRFIGFHEAGHAVAAWTHGIKINAVSTIPDEGSRGRVRHVNPTARDHGSLTEGVLS